MTSAGRRWLEISVRTSASDTLGALLVEALLSLGGRGAEERDGWYVTYVEEPEDAEAFTASAERALQSLPGLCDVEVRTRWQPHEDWAESWKRGLAPRRITERLVVRPSWTPFEAGPEDIVIVVDPGMAFGTAEHGTTRGCLRLLDSAVSAGDSVLDVGAGSGILSIAAARLGAARVTAIEGDPLAHEALRENSALNGVADRVELVGAWADAASIEALGPVSGVVANIETGLLRPLMAGILAAVAADGWLILSGILEAEWPEMREETEARGFHLCAEDADGEWRCGHFDSVVTPPDGRSRRG
jgi:ribosomal protein L11 methyltransferase